VDGESTSCDLSILCQFDCGAGCTLLHAIAARYMNAYLDYWNVSSSSLKSGKVSQ
jgi:hypothetical protein